MRIQRLLLATGLVLGLASTVFIADALASSNRRAQMRPVSNHRPALQRPAQGPAQAVAPTGKEVRLEGTLRLAGSNLYLGKNRVLVHPNTATSEGDALTSPRKLHGKRVTVFGVQGRQGVMATLIMVAPDAWGRSHIPDPSERESTSDSRVGVHEDAGS